MIVLLERGSAGQGGRGDSDLPPMPPWTPYTPFKRPRDTPGPPLYRHGHVPLSLDRQGPYRARHLVWPGASNQSGAGAGTHYAWHRCRGASRCTRALPWRHLAYTPRIDRCRGAGGGISCAEGDSGPPRDGREPSWARPCEASGALLLSNGGSGGGHETCTLWPPPAPFGYFPVWESTSSARRRTKPPTRNRFLMKGKEKGFTIFFLFLKRFRLCGGDQGAFRSPPGPLRGPSLYAWAKPPTRNKLLAEGRKRLYLSFSRIAKDFASAEATKGLSGRPLETFGPLLRMGDSTKNRFLVAGRKRAFLALSCFAESFASAEATRGLSARPLDPFGGTCVENRIVFK